MKRQSLVFVIVLALAAGSTSIPAWSKPAQAGNPGVAQKAAATPTPQAGRRPPQAKSQAEFKDYNTAYAITGGTQMEEAANSFAAKYPASELRSLLYAKAMHEYQTESNSDKMLAMGEKVLSLDPDNPIALVLTASVLADKLINTDADHTQKIAEIKKNAGHALETVDSAMTPPSQATPEQFAAYKNTVRSMAYSSLGILELKTGDDPGAERDMKAAAELTKASPDPFVWYHLALAQDHQGKYMEALASVEEALHSMGSNADLGELATGERDRLRKLTGAATLPAPGPGPKAQPSPTPPPL
jgi:tetratricopeptide (TPR) repeat protein